LSYLPEKESGGGKRALPHGGGEKAYPASDCRKGEKKSLGGRGRCPWKREEEKPPLSHKKKENFEGGSFPKKETCILTQERETASQQKKLEKERLCGPLLEKRGSKGRVLFKGKKRAARRTDGLTTRLQGEGLD